MHLQVISQRFAHTPDLYDPSRTLGSLTPYEHLHRTFRLCVAHAFRNIRKCKVTEKVKELMRSLICVQHEDWDGTIQSIRDLGGKAGNGMQAYPIYIQPLTPYRLGKRQGAKSVRISSYVLGQEFNSTTRLVCWRSYQQSHRDCACRYQSRRYPVHNSRRNHERRVLRHTSDENTAGMSKFVLLDVF